MAKSLFNISEEYLRIIDELEESGGELTEELAKRLDITQDELEAKIKAYHHIIKLREAEVQVSKDEKERLNKLQKCKEGIIKRLKTTISIAVDLFGVVKPKATSKSITFDNLVIYNKETTSLLITDPLAIPNEYCETPIYFKSSEVADTLRRLEEAEIPYLRTGERSPLNESIKTQLEYEQTLPVEERKGIAGAALLSNKTPVFK